MVQGHGAVRHTLHVDAESDAAAKGEELPEVSHRALFRRNDKGWVKGRHGWSWRCGVPAGFEGDEGFGANAST